MPDEAHEAIRDLVRARKRVKEDLREAKQALQSFLLRHDVARVIVANPLQVRAIVHARTKTDAGVLAQLRAADFLPEVWVPDPETERRRRLVARRN